MNRWMLLSIGGILGTFLRYGVSFYLPGLASGPFPYGTLAVNLSACLLLGFLDGLASARGMLGPDGRLLLMTGFCGAYSTFSTLIFESGRLVTDGEAAIALMNYVGSGVGGFILLRAGQALARVL